MGWKRQIAVMAAILAAIPAARDWRALLLSEAGFDGLLAGLVLGWIVEELGKHEARTARPDDADLGATAGRVGGGQLPTDPAPSSTLPIPQRVVQ
ncbi:hypothetical protein BaRGS_00039092 [Batillaria attramentaria]|uniref:Uncharacterized protein n=1 Tax=Batillaria attramentaria TaxID=370345 RepID=A0ABD0J3S6_9CAEN